METLQEILDNFNGSKLCNLSEGKLIQSMIGKKYGKKNLVKDELFESKRLKSIKSSKVMKENGKKQLDLVNQYHRENPICCSNCKTYGTERLMKLYHFNNCKRPSGFSDKLIYELHLKGHKSIKIAEMSNLKSNSICKILKKWKASNNI